MDPLTHTAIGLFLSRAGLNRWTPLAAPILILAANAPDIDIVSAAGGALGYLHYHRHLTHSLAAMPVMALLPVLLVRVAGRKPIRWVGAFCASMVAVASHLLLDLTNSYGIRLFLPFSSKWLRLDLTNVVDLWIWARGAIARNITAGDSPFLRCRSCCFTTAAGRRYTHARPLRSTRAYTRTPSRYEWPPSPTPPIRSAGGGLSKPRISMRWRM